MNKAKIVIFGAGEITNLLIKDLTLSGQKVLCVTDNSFGQIDDLAQNNLEIATYKEVLNNELKVDTAIFSWKDLKRFNQDHQAILQWLESEKFQATKNFHLSSASVYKHSDEPQNEECGVIDSSVKVAVEKSLKDLSIKKRSIHTDLRISNVYGSEISYGFIGSLFSSIKSGSQIQILPNLNITRDYIHVDDVIYAIKMLLEIDDYPESINISTGIGTTLSQLLDIFSAKGYNFENRMNLPNDVKVRRISILDCKRLEGLIRWQPNSLNQVLSKLVTTKSI